MEFSNSVLKLKTAPNPSLKESFSIIPSDFVQLFFKNLTAAIGVVDNNIRLLDSHSGRAPGICTTLIGSGPSCPRSYASLGECVLYLLISRGVQQGSVLDPLLLLHFF